MSDCALCCACGTCTRVRRVGLTSAQDLADGRCAPLKLGAKDAWAVSCGREPGAERSVVALAVTHEVTTHTTRGSHEQPVRPETRLRGHVMIEL